MKIDCIRIARLRGIPGGWPDLAMGEKGLVVYGPNGVGKSSIIDALEATIGGRSTLFASARSGVNWEAAAPHIKGGPAEVTVTGRLDGKPLDLVLGTNPVSDLSDWLEAAKAASFVLRRYMLLRFIDTEPKNRYEQIQPFLNLDDFINIENGLKQLLYDLETKASIVGSEVNAKAQVVRQTFGLERSVSFERSSLSRLLQEQLAKAGLASDEAASSDLTKVAESVSRALGSEESSKQLSLLGAEKHHAQQLPSVSVVLPLFEQALTALDALERELQASDQKVPVQLLEHALTHVSKSAEEVCPICEQSIDRIPLINRLSERIKEDEFVRIASEMLQARLKALREAGANGRQTYATFIAGWDMLGIGPLEYSYKLSEKLFARLEALTIKSIEEQREEIQAEFSEAECDPSIQIDIIDREIIKVGGGERRNRLAGAAALITSLQTDVLKYEELQGHASVITKRKRAADRLVYHAESARKAAVQKIADRVAEQANQFYDKIHPGEGIATSTLTVRQATSGSIQLGSTFHGREAPPLLYYSESHLDTLGLCYFLAIRKLEVESSPVFKLLLLDDVLHSVDADHRARLARLIKDNFSDHQLVIVTHDKHFYDRLRAILGGGYKYVAISGWDIEGGPRLSDPSTDLDRIINSDVRVGKSHDEIAAAGGRFFEWILKSLTERLQVAIPARFSREHDIGSMWPSLAKKLRDHRAFMAKHPDLAKDLTDSAWVRNKIGAHDNETESSITPNEVTEFVDQLAALYRATTCEDCGSTIQKSQTGAWRCDCSRLQYGS